MDFDSKYKMRVESNKDSKSPLFPFASNMPDFAFTSEEVKNDEGLTQYFEELAAKALDLTKKYGLKDEFNMIQSELKKNNTNQTNFHYNSTSSEDSFDDDLDPQTGYRNYHGKQSHRIAGPPGHRRLVLK